MRLAEFAQLIPAPPKWVQNAAAVLGVRIGYSVPEARHLALTRSISSAAEIPLKVAYRLAGEALAVGAHEGDAVPVARSGDGSVTVTVDLGRFSSGFLARLAEVAPQQRPARLSPAAAAMLEGLEAAEIRYAVRDDDSGELIILYDPAPDNVEPLAAVLRAWKAYPRGVPLGLRFIMDGELLRTTPTMMLSTVLGEVRLVRADAFA